MKSQRNSHAHQVVSRLKDRPRVRVKMEQNVRAYQGERENAENEHEQLVGRGIRQCPGSVQPHQILREKYEALVLSSLLRH
jgi:hypothetical protein